MPKQVIPEISRGVLTNFVMPLSLRIELEERARVEQTTLSDVARRAIGAYLAQPQGKAGSR